MAKVAHSIVVERPGTDLTLTAGAYELVMPNVPDLEWRRNTVEGRYQAGERLVNAVPVAALIGWVIRCKGDAWTDVDTAIADMYATLAQFEYTVTETIAGVVTVWENCQPATIRPLNNRRTSGEVASGVADFDIQIRCTPNVGSLP